MLSGTTNDYDNGNDLKFTSSLVEFECTHPPESYEWI